MTVADQQTRDMDALKRAYKETDEAHKNAVRRNKAIRDLECEIEIRSREEADLYRRASVRSKSGGPSGPNVHKPLPRSPQKGMEEVVSIGAEEGLADKMNELRGRMHHAENRAEELTKAIQAMDYNDPKWKQVMNLEGLTRWIPGSTAGYDELEREARRLNMLSERV